MTIILVYTLAVFTGMLVKFLYGIIYGFIGSIIPTSTILKLLPKSISENHNKFYLHLLWFSSEFLSTLAAYIVLSKFNFTINFIFVFLLCINPIFILYSKSMRKPENLGYFNLIYQTENFTKDMGNQIIFINRVEGISRIIGLFFCLLILKS